MINKKNFSGENNPFYGKHHSEEDKAKMRSLKLGKSLSEEHKKKISISTKKALSNPKIKEKLSNSSKKMWKEKRDLILNSRKGIVRKPWTLEQKQKMSELITQKYKNGMEHPKGMLGKYHLDITKKIISENSTKLANSDKGKKIWNERRKLLIVPSLDTSIELKVHSFLKQLNVKFIPHFYINIKHGYQCDIMIPVQQGIFKNTIIECDGDYWHGGWKFYSKLTEKQKIQREKDLLRTNELREQGFRVIRFWENEIHAMKLNDLKEVILK